MVSVVVGPCAVIFSTILLGLILITVLSNRYTAETVAVAYMNVGAAERDRRAIEQRIQKHQIEGVEQAHQAPRIGCRAAQGMGHQS